VEKIYGFMGLDLSLSSTGWSTAGQTGAITPKTNGTQRLVDISLSIKELIRFHGVSAVVMEGYAFAARSGQAFSIGELGGVVRYVLCGMNIPFVVVQPTTRAKFATGRGNSSKSEVVSAVSARTGIVWSGSGADDMCDAWILEEMALLRRGEARYDWPESSVAVVNGVDWSPIENYKGRCSDSNQAE
jgi:crossover junction endodeoxyribonuclease RuvC